jgi:transcriptional regulator with XRE-family HTH domain
VPRRRAPQIGTEEKEIGRRLRQARERLGLTQVKLAELLGLDQTLISAYERGAIRIHAALIATFAKALKTSADEVLGLKRTRTNGHVRSLGLRRRLQRMDRLPPADLRALLQTVDRFLRASTDLERS